MKILITGAGGMLGADLAAELCPKFQVSGTGRNPAPYLTIPYAQADLSNPKAVRDMIQSAEPQLIFHAAAKTNVDGCELDRLSAVRDNEQVTRYLVEAAREVKAGLIFFSTDYVYAGSKTGAYTEEDEAAPINVYGETKLNAENYIRHHAWRYWIFRVSWLYGLHGKSFARTILERAQSENDFRVVSDQTGSPTWTKDIAHAFAGLLGSRKAQFEKAANQTFHLTNSENVSWADFAEFLLKHAGCEKAVVTRIGSDNLNRPAKRPHNSVLSLSKIETSLGVSMRSWKDAAVEFIQEWKKYKNA